MTILTLNLLSLLLIDDVSVADDLRHLILDLLEHVFPVQPADDLGVDELVGLMLELHLLVGILELFGVSIILRGVLVVDAHDADAVGALVLDQQREGVEQPEEQLGVSYAGLYVSDLHVKLY